MKGNYEYLRKYENGDTTLKLLSGLPDLEDVHVTNIVFQKELQQDILI